MTNNNKPGISIMTLIGIFFAVFALSLFAAILFTGTDRGKIVNLLCGLLFLIMSGGSFIISKKSK
ncbi:MAG: hypothetical protein HYS25_09400 [Ignavibacteriales bacterium]|nr:hypothetical protein [Ignavibacteriales bacterium]